MTQKWKHREHLGKQGKFRVGDLIQLSSYGKNSAQNENEYFDGDEIGLVIKIGGCKYDKYPIMVQWINRSEFNVATRFFFRELKRIRT